MTKQKTDIREVLEEEVPETRDELYNDYVDENTPKLSWFANLCKAFLVGGLICTLGQVLMNWYMSLGMDKESAALYNTLTLILLSVLLTGWNIYPKIANFAGAGTLVPITGFANSVAAPAIEFKKEPKIAGCINIGISPKHISAKITKAIILNLYCFVSFHKKLNKLLFFISKPHIFKHNFTIS